MLNSPEDRRIACGESAEVGGRTYHQIRFLLVAFVRLRPSRRVVGGLAQLIPAVRLGTVSKAVAIRISRLRFRLTLGLLCFRHRGWLGVCSWA